MLPTPHGRRTAGEKAVERAVAPDAGLPSRVHVQHVGERGLDALLLGGGLGGGHLERATANPPKLVGDSEYMVKVNGCRRGAAPFSCPQSFPFGTGLGRPPSVSVSGRSFAGGLWDAFSAYPSQQSDGGVLARGRIGDFFGLYPLPPFCPFGRPEFRPGRRGAGGRSDARTWPIRELGGVAGDPLRWPLPQGQNCRCDRRGATESAAHESPPQTAPRPRAATGVAVRPAPQTPSFQCNGPVVRGAAAHDGRDAARVSGRNGQVQL